MMFNDQVFVVVTHLIEQIEEFCQQAKHISAGIRDQHFGI